MESSLLIVWETARENTQILELNSRPQLRSRIQALWKHPTCATRVVVSSIVLSTNFDDKMRLFELKFSQFCYFMRISWGYTKLSTVSIISLYQLRRPNEAFWAKMRLFELSFHSFVILCVYLEIHQVNQKCITMYSRLAFVTMSKVFKKYQKPHVYQCGGFNFPPCSVFRMTKIRWHYVMRRLRTASERSQLWYALLSPGKLKLNTAEEWNRHTWSMGVFLHYPLKIPWSEFVIDSSKHECRAHEIFILFVPIRAP